ncbi:hypothetical protein CANINC_002929 [Pichia inconspicua]|uniref:NADP-dependent oxidoreductase domain-containing protein n=1 Tax=Pichia inconspicua TaxID=52247 RepID=A0A4T0X018_9ASCO|nr:hypothetical protein CANINC_002929 [[Candida] inconspicua]
MSLGLKKVPQDLDGISPLILGGAVFNTQYNDDPKSMPIYSLLESSFLKGINAIDTSPYYGPSEELIGKALKELHDEGKIERDNYYICTKVGRIKLDDFDYSPEWVEKSILRSLERFNTTYLDVVFLHDIEFPTYEETIGALKKLMELKSRGLIRWVGISGYPVDYIYKVAKNVREIDEIGTLDLVMSYSNMCLQNITLKEYYDKFIYDTGVKLVNNASILSMSMLRYQETKSFHPASQALKDKCFELAIMLREKHNTDLADLATRFAIREWQNRRGRTVIGVSNVEELNVAWQQYVNVTSGKFDEEDDRLVKLSQEFLGEHFNEVWPSGTDHNI